MSEPQSTPDAGSERQPTDAGVRAGATVRRFVRRLILTLLFLIAAVVGVIFQVPIANRVRGLVPDPNARRRILYWQSPMDPDVRSDKPGKTPMGMKLVPVYADEGPAKKPVVIHPEIQEREFSTVLVEKGPLVRSLETVSTVTFAEPLVGDVTLKMQGWLEKLYVDYEGQTVKKGDPLFDVYAPDLLAAEGEFLTGMKYAKNDRTSRTDSAVDNLQSTRVKLRYLDMTDEQIDQLARKGVIQRTLTYYSPYSGIVVKKEAFAGKAIPAGQLLYRIADLSKVWVDVFVYENQIHCVYEGQEATLTLPELPDRTFPGKVSYIYPYLEPKSRTVKVRLEFANPDLLLMPDMFGRVKLQLHRMGEGLSVPRTAVMQTGIRTLVYIALAGDRFEPREIRTGMELDGNKLEVLGGLEAGDRVVASPDFLLDSESRVRLVNRKFRPPTAERDDSRHASMPEMKASPMHTSASGTKDETQHDSHGG